jgi:MFS family permease
MAEIETRVGHSGGGQIPKAEGSLTIHPRKSFGFGLIFGAMLGKHRGRSFLALLLMVAQAFLFNAVFFTYGLVLKNQEHVPDADIGLYILPLCAGNLFGPMLLGHFFDTVGRKKMIAGTYAISGVLLVAVAVLYGMGVLDATTQTLCWVGVFFFASAAASSAYLTASEIFPLETRALAIAVFYALGTLIGGAAAPALFGQLIAVKTPWALSGGYAVAALLMLAGAVAEWKLGVDAEGKSLEDIAEPLSA